MRNPTVMCGTEGYAETGRKDGPMTDPKTYSWQAAYVFAILEIDPAKMLSRIEEALKTIDERLRTPTEIDTYERTAIENARIGLAALKAERVKGATFKID